MRTLEFNTPRPADRDPQTLTVDLCGQPLKLDRPKDWVVSSLATCLTEGLVGFRVRAGTLLEVIADILGEEEFDTFLDRCRDHEDFLNDGELADFLQQIHQRWTAFDQWADTRKTRMPESENPPITIRPRDTTTTVGEPLRVVDTGLDFDHTFQPPKAIMLLVVSGMAADGNLARYALGLFLEATLTDDENRRLQRRLKARHDVFDAAHLVTIVEHVATEWGEALGLGVDDTATPANRAERRALR